MKEVVKFLLEQMKRSTHDSHVETQCDLHLAKLEGAQEADDEEVDLGPDADKQPDEEAELDLDDEDEADIATLTQTDNK